MRHPRLGLLLTLSASLSACEPSSKTEAPADLAGVPKATQDWMRETARSLSSDDASQLDVKTIHTDRLDMTTVRMTGGGLWRRRVLVRRHVGRGYVRFLAMFEASSDAHPPAPPSRATPLSVPQLSAG